MRKSSLIVSTVLAFFLMGAMVVSQIGTVSAAPEIQRVGLVIAYTAGQSITIVDRDGHQFTFELASPLKIVPPHRANMLGVGAYVTIMAPNNIPNGKHIAVGIVIHPQPPASFPMPAATFTALPTDTALPTATVLPTESPSATPTSTVVFTETPTETVTATETSTSTATSTETATPTGTLTEESPTPTQTLGVTSSAQADAKSMVASFVEWLASIFRQMLSSNR